MRTCPHCRAVHEATDDRCPGCGADVESLARTEDPLVGRVLDRYRIEACIGSGAMSRLYSARMVAGGHRVAVKVLSAEDSADPVTTRRFHQEAHAMSRLRHDSNLGALDFGQTSDGRLYLVTRMLRGRTLETILRDEGQLEPRRVVRLLSQALDAMTEAHSAGIVHRDFKPGNVFIELVDGAEHVRVIDYGIAKVRTEVLDPRLTIAGSLCGTPDYMAPEQIRGEEPDGRADLYAAGVVLYEMLTGSRPFSGSLLQILTMHLQQPAEPPALRRLDVAIPAALERVCLKAMAKRRDQRYPTAAAMRAELLLALPPTSVRGAGLAPAHEAPAFRLALVGRQRELHRLAETRRGSTLVLGPGGSGRTRLVEEWRRRLVERGEQVVVMRADPSTARLSWHPVRRALAAALGMPERPTTEDIDGATIDRPADRVGLREVFGVGGAAGSEERLFRRREAMAAAVGVLRDLGVAIACEDVDRYDRPSVEVVAALMLDPGVGRVVATATSRGDLPDVSTIELGPLLPADLQRLGIDLAAIGIDASQPQLPMTVENAHHGALSVGVGAASRVRLATLPVAARQLLVATAVAGLEVEVGLLAEVTRLSNLQAPLALLAARRLLRHEGDRVALPSPTLRDALYSASEVEERAALHRAYCEQLALRHEEPGLIAHHAWIADADEAPLDLLERAMIAAERAFDDPGAVRWGIRSLKRARALERVTPAGGHGANGSQPPRRVAVRLQPRVRTAVALGEALLRAGDTVHADRSFREALGAAGAEPLALALAHRGMARIAVARGRAEDAEAELEAAIARLPNPAHDEDAVVTGELHLELAELRDRIGRSRDAETALIQGAVRVPSAPQISWRLLLALAERSNAAGRTDDARRIATQALAAAERSTTYARARSQALLAAIEKSAGDPAGAQRHREVAVELLREAGDRLSIAELLLGSALHAGPEEAAPRNWLAEAGELARQVGWTEGVTRAHEALRQHA